MRTESARIIRLVLEPAERVTWLRRSLVLLRRALGEFRADHCPQLAAAISFHMLFSLFPLALAAVAALGLVTPHARDVVASALLRVVPLSGPGRQQLHDLLASVSGGAGILGALGLVGALWSATGVMAAIRTALNVAWDTARKRPFIRGKLVDFALLACTVLVTGATLGLSVLVGIARQEASHLAGMPRGLASAAGIAVSAAVVIGSLALLFATFALLYRLVPAEPTRLRGIWPGALAAAAGFTALQYAFSAYLAHFAHYNKVYGSLGAVIAFLFFVYLASMVFLLGAEIASEYPRLRPAERTSGAGHPANPQELCGCKSAAMAARLNISRPWVEKTSGNLC